MTSKKTEAKQWVSSSHGIIIPGSVLGKSTDVRIGPHEPVEVPAAYAEMLIHNRFAVECAPPDDSETSEAKKTPKAKAPKAKAPKAKDDGQTPDGSQASQDNGGGTEGSGEQGQQVSNEGGAPAA